MKHTRLTPQVKCLANIEVAPGRLIPCGKSMYHLHSNGTQSVYGCTAGHIRKVPRVPSSGTMAPPDNAA